MLRLVFGLGVMEHTTKEKIRIIGISRRVQWTPPSHGGTKFDLGARTAAMEHLSLTPKRDKFRPSCVLCL